VYFSLLIFAFRLLQDFLQRFRAGFSSARIDFGLIRDGPRTPESR